MHIHGRDCRPAPGRQAFQGGGEIRTGIISAGRVFCHGFENYVLHLFGQVRDKQARSRQRFAGLFEQDGGRCVGRVGFAPGDQFVKNHPEGVLVGAGRGFAGPLFGSHVLRRADTHPGAGELGVFLGVDDTGDAEIREEGHAVRVSRMLAGLTSR